LEGVVGKTPERKEVRVPRPLDPVKLPWPPPRVETRESFARRTVAHAFERNPGRVWTRESLANWYSISLTIVDEVVSTLIEAGLVRRTSGSHEGYIAAKPLRAVV
jgi:DNA-binding IscR family transcriptional regulator